MTGAYLRVKRDGKWQAIEVEYLTRGELIEAFKDRPHDDLVRWIEMLCGTLRDIDNDELQSEMEDDEHR